MNKDNDFDNQSIPLNRKQINIEKDAYVKHSETMYRITEVMDFNSIIAVNMETGRSTVLRVDELAPVDSDYDLPALTNDISETTDKDWEVVQKRLAAIRPLLNQYPSSQAQIEERAEQIKVHPTTLYRWLRLYNAYGSSTALVPRKRGWTTGKSRLPVEVESIIEEVIQNFYLTPQRPSATKTVTEVQRICSIRNITPPNHVTVRSRIAKISEQERLRKRGAREKARNKFRPAAGSFPNADYPLAVVQIDHTPADIILVDDVHRKPIGRPWITLAMDVCTRVVVGYYLSFDPPSETSIAMCVAHSILPKENWLLLHNVDAEWPVWGIPKTIHVDNGADFRSSNFQQSCLSYNINLEFRPVRQPQYGGHIERILGTLLKEIHSLPGTTFSSIKEREGYDSEKNAVMTKSEFEHWFVTLICKIYHQRLHTGIGMKPIKKWEIEVFGNGETKGSGMPPRPTDGHTVLLDFLPSFRRTVQAFGITIDGLNYYAEALRPWINKTDLDTGKKQGFVFRRDPRDISTIWFYDPILKEYFKIPLANQAFPSMSIWEYQQAKEKIRKEGTADINEHEILRTITEMREFVESSEQRTKKSRRQAQRRREHEKKIDPSSPLDNKAPQIESTPTLFGDLVEGEIKPFGDIR
ncbi:MAG: DDE-type integrase/transposase/recombinase [Alcaligenaceae bacterium]|nr:DDE-type integrase/transposase/recombinase [Alcaligenaceae bacterium]